VNRQRAQGPPELPQPREQQGGGCTRGHRAGVSLRLKLRVAQGLEVGERAGVEGAPGGCPHQCHWQRRCRCQCQGHGQGMGATERQALAVRTHQQEPGAPTGPLASRTASSGGEEASSGEGWPGKGQAPTAAAAAEGERGYQGQRGEGAEGREVQRGGAGGSQAGVVPRQGGSRDSSLRASPRPGGRPRHCVPPRVHSLFPVCSPPRRPCDSCHLLGGARVPLLLPPQGPLQSHVLPSASPPPSTCTLSEAGSACTTVVSLLFVHRSTVVSCE